MHLDGERWRSFFGSFQREAFRLETLDTYDLASEKEEFGTFVAAGRLVIPDDDAWLVRVRHFRSTGRKIGRVHVITGPPTGCPRYEFAVYRYTVAAGEDVRILDLGRAPDPGLPRQDFWLFDESAVVRMDYAADGTQPGRELLEDTDPAPYVAWKRLAMEYAEAFEEYSARLDG